MGEDAGAQRCAELARHVEAGEAIRQGEVGVGVMALQHKTRGTIGHGDRIIPVVARPAELRSPHAGEAGGLSGKPLFAPSSALLADMYRRTRGEIPLVGVGGIASGTDAYAKIRAGASLVQLYTALVYEGPGLVLRIKRDLAGFLARDGFASIAEAVGADVPLTS